MSHTRYFLLLFSLLVSHFFSFAQNVPIENYSVSASGQVQLSIEGQVGKYYVLHAQHTPNYNWAVSMTLGVDGTMVISEPAGAYPLEKYSVTEHDIANSDDYDGDDIDDMTELNNMPSYAPINYAEAIAFSDGATSLPDAQTFMDLATVQNVGWAPFLDDQLYVKFGILDRDTDEPKVYFINSNTYIIHANFWDGIDANVTGDDASGEIVFNPNTISAGGVIGTYSFNFSFGDAYDFEASQRTYELLIANMPFLQNNMNHFIGASSENNHINNYSEDFEGSRIEVVLESEVFADVNYIPFHEAEGYGFFKHMTDLNETPGSRDIVLYDALPNSLPRVGGIITSVIQTPLSHVNLRAIQDNVPNAYIYDPLSIDSIGNLLGSYIYYKVENENFQIREASLDEVNAWYENLRPTEPQIPIRDLSITDIKPLDSISFPMSASFGAKCSNVATMRTFGFPEGTIPNGFGIPFYYYHEFMLFNNFYEEAQVMIDNPAFKYDINFRTERLESFRQAIKDAPMPQWMMDNLQAMHDDFPEGTAVRCRSSTNNEDLPGFSGAGLYTSKTQNLDEGHISKSIKQIYASMWNFRAYEERDFYRVDHFMAAMGILCHPNFNGEKSNGVGISIDPIYETEGTFYLNTQVGESLITNPEPNSVPEEILLYEDPSQGGGYLVLRLSSLTNPGELVMDAEYLNQMRTYLSVIHDEFEILYDVVGAEGFGMDIEYKVSAEDQLIIKQARPWVSFWADINGDFDLGLTAISPMASSSLGSNELVTATVANKGLNVMSDFSVELVVDGESVETISVPQTIDPFDAGEFQFTSPQDFSEVGDYNVRAIVSHPNDEYGTNDTLNVLLSKVYALDGALSIEAFEVLCDEVLQVEAMLTNQGDETITDVDIEVVVNGTIVDVVSAAVNVPFLEQKSLLITISDNLQQNNIVELNIVSVNSQLDGDLSNNLATASTNLDSDYDIITLTINPDNYPQETSWEFFDERTGQLISSGNLDDDDEDQYIENICVDYTSCFSLYFYDSYGDGICCGYGEGDFAVINSSGEPLVANDGEFGSKVVEVFCPDGTGCAITADINITHVTDNGGAITIFTRSGVSPFYYSIDGGLTFQDSNTFTNLASGTYEVVINGALDNCSYSETIIIEDCSAIAVELESTNATDAVSADGSIVINSIAGLGPFQYSIDGGQYFGDSNEFYDLPIGNYNVIVQDTNEVCSYDFIVPIESEPIDPVTDELVIINEINYNSADDSDSGDWVELYNRSTDNLDLSGWIMKDDDDSHNLVFPQETVIDGNGFLILTRDQDLFFTEFPDIETVIGDFDFGLSSNGDAVRLYNADGALVDEVYYLPDSPWPTSANGEGYTLELLDPELDNSVPDNWAPVNFNGSPDQPNLLVNTDDLSDDKLQIVCFPNPTANNFTVELGSFTEWTEDVKIEVYDNLGNKITTDWILKNGSSKTNISLEGNVSGAYLVRCFNSTFEKSFVVLKI